MRISPKVFVLSVFVVLLLTLVYALLKTELALTEPGIAPALPNGALTDAQSTALQVLIDVSKLLISWTFAVMGGAALFLKLQMEAKLKLRAWDIYLIATTLLIALSSLYFAQIVFDIIVRSLVLQQSPLTNESLSKAVRWQFSLLLGAVFMCGVHIFQHSFRLSVETHNDK